MAPRTLRSGITLLALALLPNFVGAAWAGDFFFQATIGSNFFDTSPPCRINEFPTFEMITPVPAIFDPSAHDSASFLCIVDVEKNQKGVKKAKGVWETEVVMRDNRTGQIDTLFIDSGKFKTDSDGSDDFDFEIPTPIFADGFESGDVSAWSYTRVNFTNKKKADSASVQCGKSASRSK